MENLTPPPITPENPTGTKPLPNRQFSKLLRLALLGIIIFTFIRNGKKATEIKLFPSPTPTVSISWKTFNVPQFNFSIDYPADADCGTYGDDYGPNGYYTCKINKTEIITIHLTQQFIPDVYGNLMGQKPSGQRTIDGKVWNYYRFYRQDNKIKALNYFVTAYEIINNGQLIIIEFHGQDLTPEQDHILSSFHFLNDPSPTTHPETKFCGGIMGLPCPEGYTCQLDGDYPDAGGQCIKTVSPSPRPSSLGCKVAGCSGELCISASSPDIASTCIWKDEYACFKYSICEQQILGKCAWTKTPEYLNCLKNTQ